MQWFKSEYKDWNRMCTVRLSNRLARSGRPCMFSEYKRWCKADTVEAREHCPAELQATTLCQKSVTHIAWPNASNILLPFCLKYIFGYFITESVLLGNLLNKSLPWAHHEYEENILYLEIPCIVVKLISLYI